MRTSSPGWSVLLLGFFLVVAGVTTGTPNPAALADQSPDEVVAARDDTDSDSHEGTPEVSKKKNKKQNEKKEEKEKKAVSAKVSGVFLGQALFQDEEGETRSEFLVEMARVKFSLKAGKRIRGVLQTELSGLVGDEQPGASLRNAYVQYKLFPELKLRMGQFKRPFSRTELTSRYALPLTTRGVGNHWLDDQGYLGRDIGFQVAGRFKLPSRLEYSLGVFNGSGMNRRELDENGAKDASGRLEWEPVEGVTVAAHASLKMADTGSYTDDRPGTAWSAGGDIVLSRFGLTLWLEGAWFQNSRDDGIADGWWTMALVTYDWKLPGTSKLVLEPVLGAEVLVPTTAGSFSDQRVLAFTPGLNLKVGHHMKLLVQGRFVEPGAASSSDTPESRGLVVQWGVSL